MIGGYNADMINAFTEIGIANSVYGNYSSLITGADEYVHPMVDMLADASAVIFTIRIVVGRQSLNMTSWEL